MKRAAGFLAAFAMAATVFGAADASSVEGVAQAEEGGPPSPGDAPKDGAKIVTVGIKGSTTSPVSAASACAAGMVEVVGDFCPYVEQKCLRWLDPDTKMRCAEFAPTGECPTRAVHKHFCIDQFEYPNEPGAKPAVMTTWNQARTQCSAQGKRLCVESEWTLACEVKSAFRTHTATRATPTRATSTSRTPRRTSTSSSIRGRATPRSLGSISEIRRAPRRRA